MLGLIYSVRLFVTLLCFGYASYTDIKTRTVENWVWKLFASIGLTFQVTLTLLEGLPYPFYSTFVTAFLALIMWRLNAFGGADAKALITLALLLPLGFDNKTPFFPLVSLAFGCITAMPYVMYKLFNTHNFRSFELPLLPFILSGIFVSLFAGEWFTQLIF